MRELHFSRVVVTYLSSAGTDETNRLFERSANSNVAGSTDAKKNPGIGPLIELDDTRVELSRNKYKSNKNRAVFNLITITYGPNVSCSLSPRSLARGPPSLYCRLFFVQISPNKSDLSDH